MKIPTLIFGCGEVGLLAKKILEDKGHHVVAFLDNDPTKHGNVVLGVEVKPVSYVTNFEKKTVAIGIFKGIEGAKAQLISLGVLENNIIIPVIPNKIFPNDNLIEIPSKYSKDNRISIFAFNSENEKNNFIANIEKNKEIINYKIIKIEQNRNRFKFILEQIFFCSKDSIIDKTAVPLSLVAIDTTVECDLTIPNNIIFTSSNCEEYIHQYQIFFENDNTINFLLNRCDKKLSPVFLTRLNELKKILKHNKIPQAEVCVVSGAIKEAYGHRETKDRDDIDVIMTNRFRFLYGEGLVIISDFAEVHKQNVYTIPDQDIVLNSDNYFYFNGIKFANIHIK